MSNILKERLIEAIKDEKKAGPFYRELAKLAEDPEAKKDLAGMASDEDKHYSGLKKIFEKLYPDVDLDAELGEKAEPKAEDKKMLEGAKATKWVDLDSGLQKVIRDLAKSGVAISTIADHINKNYTVRVTSEDLQEGLRKDLFYDISTAKLKKAYTSEEISEKHGVSVEEIDKAFEIGKKIEMEHTDDEEEALRIASHHLWEHPDYYDAKKGLPAMEKGLEGEKKEASKVWERLAGVDSFEDLSDLKEDLAGIMKVAEVKDTEANKLVDLFHDGDHYVLCHRFDGQIVIPVDSPYLVVVGNHHVVPFDEGFVYINSYSGEVSSKDFEEVKQVLFPEIIAGLKRQAVEFEPDKKTAPKVSEELEKMFKSTDNYQKAIQDMLR